MYIHDRVTGIFPLVRLLAARVACVVGVLLLFLGARAQEGIFHDPLNSGPSAPFVVIWQVGGNQGGFFHTTEITPLFDYVRLINSPPLAGSNGSQGAQLLYNCPTATNQFVYGLHPLHGATFEIGGMQESTTLGYGWPTGTKYGGGAATGYYNLKFKKKSHPNGNTIATYEFNAWLTGGQWHTNAPERELLEGGIYHDPVVQNTGMSRIVVRVMMAGVERIIQATINGPAGGSAPTPANFAPVGLGDYTVKVHGQVNGITLTADTDISITFAQSRIVTFYFDSEGNLVQVGGSGGGTGGNSFPNESWWGNLFETLFVPSEESVESVSDTWADFTNWGPGAIYNQLQSAWNTQIGNGNTGVTPYGLMDSGAPRIRIPMDALGASEVGLAPLPDLEIDLLSGMNEDGSDGIDNDGNSVWTNFVRPWMGYAVYIGFAFVMISKFWPRHNI